LADCETQPDSACVESSPPEDAAFQRWTSETQQQFTKIIPKLKLCAKGIDTSKATRIALTLDFASSGNVSAQHVYQTTTANCEVTDCIKRALRDFKTSAPQSKFWHFTALLVAKPGRDASFALRDDAENLTFIAAAEEESACADKSTDKVWLSPQDIQKVVRARYDQFRKCYEIGLGRNRNLCGKIQVRFVIADQGKVSSVQVAPGTTMPDCDVVRCIKQQYSELEFSEPDGGIVTVVYPTMFVPGD
jgi:hypothetical protein